MISMMIYRFFFFWTGPVACWIHCRAQIGEKAEICENHIVPMLILVSKPEVGDLHWNSNNDKDKDNSKDKDNADGQTWS